MVVNKRVHAVNIILVIQQASFTLLISQSDQSSSDFPF